MSAASVTLQSRLVWHGNWLWTWTHIPRGRGRWYVSYQNETEWEGVKSENVKVMGLISEVLMRPTEASNNSGPAATARNVCSAALQHAAEKIWPNRMLSALFILQLCLHPSVVRPVEETSTACSWMSGPTKPRDGSLTAGPVRETPPWGIPQVLTGMLEPPTGVQLPVCGP